MGDQDDEENKERRHHRHHHHHKHHSHHRKKRRNRSKKSSFATKIPSSDVIIHVGDDEKSQFDDITKSDSASEDSDCGITVLKTLNTVMSEETDICVDLRRNDYSGIINPGFEHEDPSYKVIYLFRFSAHMKCTL